MVKKSLTQHQTGFVSITVALIMMIIITLLIFSYSLVARREQRLALDRRLSSQAYYAAESGINKIRSDLNNGRPVSNTSTCAAVDIDAANAIQNTCLLVDNNPNSLLFDPVTTSQSKIVKINTLNANGSNAPGRLEFYWQPNNNPTSFSNSTPGTFPSSATYSVLRISLTKLTNGTFTRDTLFDNTATAFLYPSTNAETPAAVNFNASDQGIIVQGNCDSSRSTDFYCKATITLTNNSASQFLLKLSSIYQPAKVTIKAYDAGTGGNQLNFSGAQAVVDSTGRAQDVLRRLQARVPLDNSWTADSWSVSANKICKTYEVASTTTSADCPFN